MADDADAELARKARATAPSATRAAVSRALARSSTGRASSNPYFCMPVRSAWPGLGRVSGAPRPRETLGQRHVLRVHHLAPPRPLGVADREGDGGADGAAVDHAADDAELVLLELLPRPAADAEAPPGEVVTDRVTGHGHAGGQPFEDGGEARAVRLTGGQPAQHRAHPPMPAQRPTAARIAARMSASCGRGTSGSASVKTRTCRTACSISMSRPCRSRPPAASHRPPSTVGHGS